MISKALSSRRGEGANDGCLPYLGVSMYEVNVKSRHAILHHCSMHISLSALFTASLNSNHSWLHYFQFDNDGSIGSIGTSALHIHLSLK